MKDDDKDTVWIRFGVVVVVAALYVAALFFFLEYAL
jgi:hypothetical protein